MSARKKRVSISKIIFRIVLLIAALALVLSYLSIFINPAKMWLPLFFGLYFIPLLIINVILLIYSLVKKSNASWITILAIAPTLLFINLFVKSDGNKDLSDGESIAIMTYNVGQFKTDKDNSGFANTRKRVFDYIAECNPDIITLQEYVTSDTSFIRDDFRGYDHIHYHLFALSGNRWFGNITASKLPMKGKGKISFKGSTNLSLYTDLIHNKEVIRIYNTHLESYNISFTSIIKRDNKENKKLAGEIIEVHDKMIGSNIKRGDQVNEILNHIEAYNGKAIICGDFNDTPMSYTYHKLSRNMKDSFLEAGKGFSATYRVLWPLLRIDYILFPEPFNAVRHTTPRVTFSDHYPVITNLLINK